MANKSVKERLDAARKTIRSDKEADTMYRTNRINHMRNVLQPVWDLWEEILHQLSFEENAWNEGHPINWLQDQAGCSNYVHAETDKRRGVYMTNNPLDPFGPRGLRIMVRIPMMQGTERHWIKPPDGHAAAEEGAPTYRPYWLKGRIAEGSMSYPNDMRSDTIPHGEPYMWRTTKSLYTEEEGEERDGYAIRIADARQELINLVARATI